MMLISFQWTVDEGVEQCREVWSGLERSIFGIFTFIFQFLIPSVLSGKINESSIIEANFLKFYIFFFDEVPIHDSHHVSTSLLHHIEFYIVCCSGHAYFRVIYTLHYHLGSQIVHGKSFRR